MTNTNVKTQKGLILDIYRNDYDSPINKMKGKKSVVLIDEKIPGVFSPGEDMPAVRLVTRNLFGSNYTHAEPLEPGSYAFGGSFIYTSDSRLKEVATYPIPLHDRQMNLEVNFSKPKYGHLKQEAKTPATGTSYHGITIKASPATLREILGEPTCEDNTGEDKVNIEWERQTIGGTIFTVYDWKEYKTLEESEEIEWHIGGYSLTDTQTAKEEIEAALNAL